MGNLNAFKGFVKKNPQLIKYVKNSDMTWQKFYEIYDLYGEEETAWSQYLKEETKEEKEVAASVTGATIGDFLGWLKNIDLDSLQEGVSSLQRVVGVIGDLTTKNTDTTPKKEEYKPRPLYKHFDD